MKLLPPAFAFPIVLLAAQTTPPPMGKLVDAGGYRVHLYCTGSGSPAVFIAGGYSFDWALVQPAIAKIATVCTYDVSGTAWSDPGPSATCQGRATEIHNLIQNAPIGRPFIFVGFSIGALVAREYASLYPGEIAAMVFVDHAFLPPGDGAPKPDAAPAPDGNSPPVLIYKPPIVFSTEDSSLFQNLPERVRELHHWAESRKPAPDTAATAKDCLVQLQSADRVPHPLGHIPLVVISTGNASIGYAELQSKLLSLSSNSRRLIAKNSFHSVEIDQPDVAIDGIRQAVELVWSGAKLP